MFFTGGVFVRRKPSRLSGALAQVEWLCNISYYILRERRIAGRADDSNALELYMHERYVRNLHTCMRKGILTNPDDLLEFREVDATESFALRGPFSPSAPTSVSGTFAPGRSAHL